jgi:hypothetical protein
MNDRARSYGLSKSLILKGIQCPKALYLAKFPPDFELPPKPELEARYRAGIEVGHLAQQLFPGGIEVPYEGLSVAEQVARTRDLIAGGAEIIYEASFVFEGIFVKADILVRRGDGWEIHEVKMATGVKEVNHDDAAIQYYVLNGCGLDVARAFIVHIDNRYVRQGQIEVELLFAGEDVTGEVLARQAEMPRLIADLRAALQGQGEPAIDIGPQCTDPYECDFIPYCWRHIPEDSVFSLRGRGIDKFACYRQGLVRLADLPPERLNGAQRFQAEATLRQRDHVDPNGIREFLAELWHPLCHLDFETFDTPIPPFDGTRPYQKIPFQYSLHIEPQEGAEPLHRDFLAAPGEDPRRALAEKLLAEIPEDACILTYNQAFEKGVLRDLAARFPDLAGGLEKRIANIRDLMRPFKQRHIYRWTMRGSYSIKEVLPALVPELSYKGMAVADGQMAMLAWDELGRTEDPARAEQIRQALREYCRLDTLAMVKILAEVRRLAAGG